MPGFARVDPDGGHFVAGVEVKRDGDRGGAVAGEPPVDGHPVC